MKSKEELKNELHKLIDAIEDEHTLNVLNEDVVPYIISSRTKELDEEELSIDERDEIEEALRQIKAGETVTDEEYLNATARWRTK